MTPWPSPSKRTMTSKANERPACEDMDAAQYDSVVGYDPDPTMVMTMNMSRYHTMDTMSPNNDLVKKTEMNID